MYVKKARVIPKTFRANPEYLSLLTTSHKKVTQFPPIMLIVEPRMLQKLYSLHLIIIS